MIQVFNYSVKNESADKLTIYIDGRVVDSPTQDFLKEWYGDDSSVSFKSLRNEIEKANVSEIELIINSPGGYVGDAMAIHDYMKSLQDKGTKVTTRGIGIVASAATYILMCTDNCSMSENSLLMIHNVSGGIWGSVKEVENYARALRKFNDLIVDFYTGFTGLSKGKVSDLMDEETWMNADEAKDKGFVKNVAVGENFKNTINPEHFPYRNKAMLNYYNTQISNQNIMSKKLSEAINNGFNDLLEGLGLKKTDATNKALENFSKSITNAIENKDGEDKGVTEDQVRKVMNKAFENFKKELEKSDPENDLAEKIEDLSKEVKNLKKQISENAVPPGDGEGDDGDDGGGVTDYLKGVSFSDY